MSQLKEFASFLEGPEIEIIAPPQKKRHEKAYRSDVESAILETISRRPCTLQDLASILGLHVNEINKYLRAMEDGGRLERMEQERGVFYQIRS